MYREFDYLTSSHKITLVGLTCRKAWRQLHKNAARFIEQVSTPKSSSCTATYHPSWKLSKLDEPDMRRSKDELINDVLLWTPSYVRARIGRPARTYIQHHCTDSGCSLEDLPGAMEDRDGWREEVREIMLAAWHGDYQVWSAADFVASSLILLCQRWLIAGWWWVELDK